MGSTEISATTLPGGIVLTAGPSFTNWSVDLTQTGSLRAGCPTPCQTVRTDNVTQSADGTDIGFFAGGEFYPGHGPVGLYLLFRQTTFQDVYDPTAALAWPANWDDRSILVGGVVRIPR